MGKITFILGGARSGKSNFAIELAKKYKNRVAYIATAQAFDKEMKQRIKLHKKIRPKYWQTIEETKDIALALKRFGENFKCIIIDCLTLFISNLILEKYNPKQIEEKIKKIISRLKKINGVTIIVSNEVGLGIVPKNKLARYFRDIAGKMNQIVAKESNEVFFLVSGIPWRIK